MVINITAMAARNIWASGTPGRPTFETRSFPSTVDTEDTPPHSE